jgi:excisionase family DNA binding protein
MPMTENNLGSDYLKIGAAARFMGVNRRTIYRWIWSDKLPASKVGGLYYIRRADLEAKLDPTRAAEFTATPPVAAAPEILKCGTCFRLLESADQIAEICAGTGCETLICNRCSAAGERYCPTHQPDSAQKWQQALSRHQAGDLPVLVRDRSARLQEINFLNRIEERVSGMSTLLHPVSQEILTIADWDAHKETSDDRAQVMHLLGKMVLDAETTARVPLNAELRWTLPPQKKQTGRPLQIEVCVYSHLEAMLRDGFDTQPLSEAELTPRLLALSAAAETDQTVNLVLLAATSGWDSAARQVITGDEPGTAFAHRQLLVYLFDLQTRELVYNHRDDRLRGYAELFAPLLPSEELEEVLIAIENQMTTYESLTLEHAAEVLPFSAALLQTGFEKLAATGSYTLTDIPDLGLAIIKS